MSGSGHPESADLTGHSAAYIIQQMEDFRSGARKDSARMNGIVQGLSNEEIRLAAEWFASLKPQVWTKVTEAAMVPKTFVGGGRMRFASPGNQTEPIGNRIITLPQDQSRATLRDPHSGFTAIRASGKHRKRRGAREERRKRQRPSRALFAMEIRLRDSAMSRESRECIPSISRGSCTCSRMDSGTDLTRS
jgi:hypothetical protein